MFKVAFDIAVNCCQTVSEGVFAIINKLFATDCSDCDDISMSPFLNVASYSGIGVGKTQAL